MTFRSFYDEMAFACVLLLVAYVLREKVPIFRKLYLPTSVVAGVLGLVIGPQVLGLVTIPESLSTYAGVLLDLICTAATWGVIANREKIKSYSDFICLMNCSYWSQLFYGGVLGILLMKIWTDLPKAWGTELIFSFASGHGTAISMGKLYEEMGVMGNVEMGVVMSTIGLMVAMVIGMACVNFGIRRGWAKYMRSKTADGTFKRVEAAKGYVPEEKQSSIGVTKVHNSSVNNLLFQFAMLMALQFVGKHLFKFLGRFIDLVNDIPSFAYGIIAALIIYPIFCKLKIDKYVDTETNATISGFCVDIVIVGAIATLNLTFIAKFAVPLLIICLVATLLNLIFVVGYAYCTCKDEWFEKACFVYGQSTGVVATGLALLRALDPDGEAALYEVQGVGNGVSSPFIYIIFAMIPSMAIHNPGSEIWLGLGLFLLFAVAGWILRPTRGMKLNPRR